MLADAAGEDQAVETLQGVRHDSDFGGDAMDKEVDGFASRRCLACQQHAHVGGQA